LLKSDLTLTDDVVRISIQELPAILFTSSL